MAEHIAIVAIAWCSALLAILVAWYRLGPLRALAALVLVVVSWFGSGRCSPRVRRAQKAFTSRS